MNTSDNNNKLFKISNEADIKSLQFLLRALDKNNQQGFDYIEFKQALEALKEIPMAEDLAIKSAYTTGMTMGLTKEKLIESAEFYKQVIQNEKAQFDVALKNQFNQKVSGRKTEQEKYQEQIERNEDLIKSLQNEVVELKKQIDLIDQEINQSVEKIEDSRYKFEHTFSEILSIINQDLIEIGKL